ncbi:MAG TPA: class I SAM-dependent methyltransferase [Candidatus Rifleibacterium sp.]|nr:class I SAM-dependent methyltransferase [Candidatus Rifleibacterium sp.]
MNIQKTIAMINAITASDHELFDWRSTASERCTAWISESLWKFVNKGGKIVELGCGTGKQTYALENIGLDCLGIDICKNAIRRANENKKRYNSQARFQEASYFKIPYNNNTFDYVLFHKNIVECSKRDFGLLVQEISRVVIPDGKLFITIKNNDNCESLKKVKKTVKIITVKDGEEFEYPTYEWNKMILKESTSNFFTLENQVAIENEKYSLMIFKKKSHAKCVDAENGAR